MSGGGGATAPAAAAAPPLPCSEVFDENSQPSAEEISDYAVQIGIDPASESHLLSLAKDGLMQALPAPWKAYYDDKLKVHYFYNTETKVTQWDHPLDQIYKNLVVKARQASERGDSLLDDTCVSIQDLITYEEDPKPILEGRPSNRNTKNRDGDSSIEASLEEEIVLSRNENKKHFAHKSVHQEKKSLPPVSGLSESMLDFLNRSTGESNTFPRTSQIGINKTKKPYKNDSNMSDNSTSPMPNSKNTKLVKQSSEIIDLSFNPNKKEELFQDVLYKPPVKKGGIVLTGGGSVFLKSNRLNQSLSIDGKSSEFLKSNGTNNVENPKGILRERSFGEMVLKTSYSDKCENNKIDIDEDKKSVRFNLDQPDMEIQYDYSPSPSSNSSSDLLLGGNQNSVIHKNSNSDMFNVERTVLRRNSESSIQRNVAELTNHMKNGKLKPLIHEENGKLSNQETNKDQVPRSTYFGVRTKSEDSSALTGSPTRKLIKPNPGDFIKPNLFQKPFEKLSDILKTASPESESDSDKPANHSSPPPSTKRRLSINLMESVDSEASMESPDKEILDNAVKLKNGNTEGHDVELFTSKAPHGKMSVVDENDVKNYRNEFTNLKSSEVNKLKHRMDMELLEMRQSLEKNYESDLRTMREKLHNEHIKNRAELNEALVALKKNQDSNIKDALDKLRSEFNSRKEKAIQDEKLKHSNELFNIIKQLNDDHSNNIEKLKQTKKNELMAIAANLEKENVKAINELKMQYSDNLEAEKLRLIADNKSVLDKMKTEHESLCDELRKDYRSEVELVRGQQAAHLSALRDKLRREREQRPPTVLSPPSVLSPRDDTSYERLRCDKRLLEDKYRCLKEKYARLKSDVKISIERRNKRREQSVTTGSETEKSHSHRTAEKSTDGADPNSSNLRNRSNVAMSKNSNNNEILSPTNKEAFQENNNKVESSNYHREVNTSHSDSLPPQGGNLLHVKNLPRKSPNYREKSPMGRFCQKSFNGENDNSIGLNDASLSHSESHTISNSKCNKRVNIVENVKEKPRDGFKVGGIRKFRKEDPGYADTTVTDYHDSSDTGASEHHHVKESLIGKNRKKLFTRLKSASTSRLNYTVSSKLNDKACSPVENLRQQLRKLEDLEEQFPDFTINADTTAYRLRYPFPDSGSGGVSGGELGFLRHRALVEREGVRRARAVIRRRADLLRQKRRSPAAWQEECELTDMEVSLHRTKSILGEKVIRLRHIEKSLRRIQDGQDPKDAKTDSNLQKHRESENKDTTLSDISSHSSGFSSTEGHSDANRNAKHINSATDFEHSSEIINSLQTLNTEIRDIWQVLNTQQQMNVAKVIPIGQLLYTDIGWQLPIAASNIPNIQSLPNSMSLNVPTLNIPSENIKDKLQNYRQMDTKLVQTNNSSGVATSLVEKTRDLRDWLKQQAAL